MYLKDLIEKHGKENLFEHEEFALALTFYKKNDASIAVWAWKDGNIVHDNTDKFGLKRVLFNTYLLDDKWSIIDKK